MKILSYYCTMFAVRQHEGAVQSRICLGPRFIRECKIPPKVLRPGHTPACVHPPSTPGVKKLDMGNYLGGKPENSISKSGLVRQR